MNDTIILKFDSEYELNNAVSEIYYVIHNSYDKMAIEEVKQMLLQFQEE